MYSRHFVSFLECLSMISIFSSLSDEDDVSTSSRTMHAINNIISRRFSCSILLDFYTSRFSLKGYSCCDVPPWHTALLLFMELAITMALLAPRTILGSVCVGSATASFPNTPLELTNFNFSPIILRHLDSLILFHCAKNFTRVEKRITAI